MQEPRDCEEFIQPDNSPWPVPRGFPVILADNRAYWFKPIAISGKDDDPLLLAFNEAYDAEMRRSNGTGSFIEYVKAIERLATVSLSSQYSEAKVTAIIESEAIDAARFADIIAAIGGNRPYEVKCKKK